MDAKTIQDRLNETVRYRAQAEFTEALQEVHRILRPFFAPIQNSDYRDEKSEEEVIRTLSSLFYYDDYYHMVCTNTKLPVPGVYVRKRQSQVSEEFWESMNLIFGQIDDPDELFSKARHIRDLMDKADFIYRRFEEETETETEVDPDD